MKKNIVLLFLFIGFLFTSYSCKKKCIDTTSEVRIILKGAGGEEVTFGVYSLEDITNPLYYKSGVWSGGISLELNEGNYFVRASTGRLYVSEKAFQVQRCKDITVELK